MKTQITYSKNIILIILTVAAACLTGCARGPFTNLLGSGSSEQASLLGGSSVAESKALLILQNNCTACHTSSSGPAYVFNLLDVNHLISSGMVVPGQPDASPLLQSIEANRMPLRAHFQAQTSWSFASGLRPALQPQQIP